MLSPCVALRFIARLYSLNYCSHSSNNTENVDDLLRLAIVPGSLESPTQLIPEAGTFLQWRDCAVKLKI